MKILLFVLSSIGILLTIIPSVLVLSGVIDSSKNNLLMSIGMVIWFISVPVYLNKYRKEENNAQ